jgi:hypothetical protein
MAIESNVLRNLVQTPAGPDAPVDLRAGKDLPAQTHSRFALFRSGAEKTANRAQFDTLKGILAGDPALLSAPGAAHAAYAAVAKAAASGAPLTSRLIAQAYRAGDQAVQAHRDAMAVARGDVLGQAVKALEQDLNSGLPSKLLPDDPRLEALSDPTLPPSTRTAVAAVIMDQARADLAALGHHFDPAIADAGKLIRAAAATSVDRIAAVLANPPSSPASGSVPPRIAPLVDDLKAFSQMRTGARLYASAGANMHVEQEVGRTMQRRLAAMSNESFLPLYKTLHSADLMEFRLQLAQARDPGSDQLLADLNSWEGFVHEEMARRVALGTGPGLSGNNLAVLGGAEHAASKEALARQTDDWLHGITTQRTVAPGASTVARAHGVTLDALQKTMHDAELTINVPFHLFASSKGGPQGYQTLMGEGGRTMPERLVLKNVFDFGAAAKGADYIERRQLVEHAQFPSLVGQDTHGIAPKDHPISAAMNFGRSVDGAGGTSYGTVVLVLKPEVRDRCTYTPRDSFYAYEAGVDAAGKDRFMAGLNEAANGRNPLISSTFAKMLRDQPDLVGALRGRLDQAAADGLKLGPTHGKALDEFVYGDLLAALPKGTPDGDRHALFNLAIKSFVDPEASRAHVATRDHLDRLFSGMKDDTRSTLAGATDPLRVNGGGGYIEAQVWGGIDLMRDVAEIRLPDAERGGLLAGVSDFVIDRDLDADRLYGESAANIQRLADELGIKTKTYTTTDLAVKRLATDETSKPFAPSAADSVAATRTGGLASFRRAHLPALLDKYQSHEQGFDPTGLHGRRHVSRALLYANVLANIVRAQGGTIDSHALYTTTVLHDVGREGNGMDVWEAQSAAAAVAALGEMGITEKPYLDHATACIQSEQPASQWTLERGLLKSADSLDIMRTTGRAGYRPEHLWFMNADVRVGEGRYLRVDPALRSALIDEVHAFITATEPHTPSEALLDAADSEFNTLSMQDGDAGTEARMMELAVIRRGLHARVAEEHRALNAGLDSATLFDGLEKALLDNPGNYPTLHRYYDPSR